MFRFWNPLRPLRLSRESACPGCSGANLRGKTPCVQPKLDNLFIAHIRTCRSALLLTLIAPGAALIRNPVLAWQQ